MNLDLVYMQKADYEETIAKLKDRDAEIARLKEQLKPDVRTVCAFELGLDEGKSEIARLREALQLAEKVLMDEYGPDYTHPHAAEIRAALEK